MEEEEEEEEAHRKIRSADAKPQNTYLSKFLNVPYFQCFLERCLLCFISPRFAS